MYDAISESICINLERNMVSTLNKSNTSVATGVTTAALYLRNDRVHGSISECLLCARKYVLSLDMVCVCA